MKKLTRRKRLTDRQWFAFKAVECFNHPNLAMLAAREAERSGNPIHVEFDKIARIYLEAFYFALAPKQK